MDATTVKKRKELTAEQLDVLKERLIKAREAKMKNDKSDYDKNKLIIKEENFKNRTMKKMKTLLNKGTLKEEELKEILPQQMSVNKVVDEIQVLPCGSSEARCAPFEKPLPAQRIPKSIPEKQPDIIPFEVPLPSAQVKAKKDKFLKIIYYHEPSQKTLKKLQKIQESSSEEDISSEEPEELVKHEARPTENNEDDYYRQLARKFFN